MSKIYPILFVFILVTTGCKSKNQTTGDLTSLTNNSEVTDEDTRNVTLLPPENNCTDLHTVYLGETLIENGSFEEGHNLGNNKWGVYESLGAWQVDRTYNDAGMEIQNGQTIGELAPYDGDAKLEFDAHGRNGFTASDVDVYQEIDTDAGSDYLISFYYSPRVSGNQTTNKAEVFWDGQLVATLNSEVKGWQKYTLVLSGAGADTRLSFKGYIDGDTVGGYLDNVSVQEVLAGEENAYQIIQYRSCESSD